MPLRTRRWTGPAARAPLLALTLWIGGVGGVAMASENGDVALPKPSLEGEVPIERLLALRRSVHECAFRAIVNTCFARM